MKIGVDDLIVLEKEIVIYFKEIREYIIVVNLEKEIEEKKF